VSDADAVSGKRKPMLDLPVGVGTEQLGMVCPQFCDRKWERPDDELEEIDRRRQR
jgi:hypothetical protein